MAKLKPGDLCKLRLNGYMQCRVKRLLPKGLAEVECSSDGNFAFGLIKTFRLRDLVATVNGGIA